MRLSVVVPAFNEEDLLEGTVSSLSAALEGIAPGAWEILVVDDGSTDRTGSIGARLMADSRVSLVRHPCNLGKGAAVRSGILRSRGEAVLVSDADLSTPPEAIPRLLAALEQGADIAVGCRWGPDSQVRNPQPLLRRVLGAAYARLARAVTGLPLLDFNCGFKLFRGDEARGLFGDVRARRWTWDVEVLFLARERGLAIREVPVPWSHRHASRVRPWRDALHSLVELLGIVTRPCTGRRKRP